VTNRIEKWFTSLGFALRKAYWKIVAAKPSVFIIAIIVVALSIFLLGGGIYDLVQHPLSVIPYGGGVLFFYPGLQNQVVYESVGVIIVYSIGVAGILLMYQSTKYAYKPRQAFMMLLVGVVLILVAYFYVENLLSSKMTFRG
jgi:hypothetical protein